MVKPTVLVIGGTGQVGRYIVSHLISIGFNVHLVSRTASKIPDGANPIIADLSDPSWSLVCKKNISAVDAIVYAAYSKSEDALYDRRVNYEGLIEVLSAVNTKRVIFFSSIGVFGTMPEEKEHSEHSPKHANTSYQKDKIDACKFLEGLSRNIAISVLHLAIVYDVPCERFDNYRSLLSSGYILDRNVGRGMYNLVHARDAAEAAILALKDESISGYHEYIVCSESIKYTDLIKALEIILHIPHGKRLPHFLAPIARGPVRKILRLFGFRPPLVIPQPKASWLNNSATFSSRKIKDYLNWKPSFFIRELTEPNKN